MNDTFQDSIAPPGSYELTAPPAPSRAPRVWAGAILLLAGLGLVVLAGCFLIGVIILLTEPMLAGEGMAAELLFVVLLLIAFSCLVGAVILFFFGVRGLLRIMNE